MPFTTELPEWGATGTKPPQDIIDNGYGAGDKPAAGWWNYFQNRTYQALLELQQKSGEVKTINGGSPDASGDISINFDTSTLATKTEVTTHIADYVKHPGTATTTNSGNSYSVTLNPAPTAYVNSMGVVLTINADSTGAATLNANGLGAKPIKKANGNDVTNLKANGVYTLRYNSAANSGNGAFILQGEGGEYGNVTAADVLQGKIFGTENGLQTGILTIASLGGSRIITGQALSSSAQLQFTMLSGGNTNSPYLNVSGLALELAPKWIVLSYNNYFTIFGPPEYFQVSGGRQARMLRINNYGTGIDSVQVIPFLLSGNAQVSNDGFTIPFPLTSTQVNWTAIG